MYMFEYFKNTNSDTHVNDAFTQSKRKCMRILLTEIIKYSTLKYL